MITRQATKKATKPDTVDEGIWADNQRWLKLMTTQADYHRQDLDPRLYRKSAKQHLIKPPESNKY